MRSKGTDPKELEENKNLHKSIRPTSLSEFIGQKSVVEKLQIYIKAAREREEDLDHVLLFGPPGLGKTTLAHIIANELNVKIKTSSGPVIEKAGDLAGILTNLSYKDVFFIDEIHRMNNIVEEYLYSAMEDYFIDIVIDQGPSARSIQLDLENFTLVGATTRLGKLTSPMRERFGVILRMNYYKPEELYKIVIRAADIIKVDVDRDGAMEIARRARGTPRIANRILKRTRDYAQVKADGKINERVAKESLQMLDIDEAGLDEMDRTILKTIINKFEGGPVGLKSLAVAVAEDKATIEDVYEPYLIQEGYLKRTARGRIVTSKTRRYLKDYDQNQQKNIF